MRRRALCLSLAAVLGATGGAASAQSYPTKTITLIVPFNAGGTGDFIGRLLARDLEQKLGQTVTVENRTGATGWIGADAMARSAPDGHTLALLPLSMANLSHVQKTPVEFTELVPVTMVADTPNLLVVEGSSPMRSWAEALTYMRSKPREISFGYNGSLGPGQLAMERIKQKFDLSIQGVPYKGGSALATDLMGGHIQIGLQAPAAVAGFIKTNRVRVLATTGRARLTSTPDVPTLLELGVAGADAGEWFGLFAPKRTPPEVVRRLNAEIGAFLRKPATVEALATIYSTPTPTTPDEARNLTRAEIEKAGKLIKELGLKSAD